ncbi:hypothetical protein 015DV002_253 [Bacillus phage 015DV002]|nr:hypothetical protein 000TH008_5 [Bacillus phage 000TH008]QQO40699.1 hypothetical protein 000TH009_5 [Bacillus phage 000TH009]QQO40965.1 hypothetical protein 015DV002_5 [Bacillus phage 015DV002]QQO41222.1 hypothetical protein 015DV004_6 [Bacillus phage 015DV004]QQO40691.1 hypothetical protein 000TH008_263 [Bacillus phage 000TH008]
MSKVLKTTSQDNIRIAKGFNGEPAFTLFDLEEYNIDNAADSFQRGDMLALVNEHNGEIIGYIHYEHAEEVATVLNLHVLRTTK